MFQFLLFSNFFFFFFFASVDAAGRTQQEKYQRVLCLKPISLGDFYKRVLVFKKLL